MKVVVVGGVAAGMSAAARLRRLNEDAEIVVFERDEYVSFANCGLPYHIGGEIADRPVHFGEVHATLYHLLGVAANKTTVPDLSGRPRYLVDDFEPMPELI